MESYIARIGQFEGYLVPDDGQVICLPEFRHLCFGGIPDKPGLRQTCWKILLGYLPLDKSRWDSVLMEQRRLYYGFVKDLIVEPELEDPCGSVDEDESSSNKGSSEWSLFLQDNKTLEQIDKDVRRTLPDFAFFQLPIPYSSLCPLSIEPKRRKPKTPVTSKDPTVGSVTGTIVLQTIMSSGSTGSLPESTSVQRRRTKHGSSMDLKRASITRTLTPTLKRRQTVTVMSPMAEKINGRSGDTDHWQSTTFSSSAAESGTETPPLSLPNGIKTPNNYSSPVLSRLRGMAKAHGDGPEDVEEAIALPDYLFSPIPTRRSLFKRVAHLNQDFGSRQHQPHSLRASRSKDSWTKKRHNQRGSRQKQDCPLSTSPESTSESDDSCHDELPQDLHWEAIERILFIYAKLNPGVGYVQGMNEILGPLYYLLANDPDEVSRAHAEAESFWLFHLLMAHSRDHFVRSLDRDRTSGIGSTIARMNFRLRQFDEHLWQNLEDKAIAPEYYSFRWLTVLCTQEFEVPDVWRIWDSVLADTGGAEKDYDFLLDFGCAMVCHLRTDLLEGDFADNVKLLQNYPPVDIQPILYLATVIRDQRVSGMNRSVATSSEPKDSRSHRPSIDLRIWSTKASISDQHGQSGHSSIHHQDLRAWTIDGVQNSDRLDYNLEGMDHHRSPLYSPLSASVKKDRSPSLSGLSLDGLWLRNSSGDGPVSLSAWSEKRPSSPSSLSVDNYAMGRDVRPQTATWAETFTLFRARIAGLGSSASSVSGGSGTGNGDSGSPGTQVAIPGESVGVLWPSAEL